MIGIGTDFANLSGERSYSLSYYTKGRTSILSWREYVRSARQTARTLGSPGCFASLRSVQGAAPLALLTQLSRRTLQRKQSTDADHLRRKV